MASPMPGPHVAKWGPVEALGMGRFYILLFVFVAGATAEAFNCDRIDSYYAEQNALRGRYYGEIERLKSVINHELDLQAAWRVRIDKSDSIINLLSGAEDRLQSNDRLLNRLEPLLTQLLTVDAGLVQLNDLLKAEIQNGSEQIKISQILTNLKVELSGSLSPDSQNTVQNLIDLISENESVSAHWSEEYARIVQDLKSPKASALTALLESIYRCRYFNGEQANSSKIARSELVSDKTEFEKEIERSNTRITQAQADIGATQKAIENSVQEDARIKEQSHKCPRPERNMMIERLKY